MTALDEYRLSPAAAAEHVRRAITELRMAKTSLGRARHKLPPGELDVAVGAFPPRLQDVEKELLKLARKLEAGEPEQLPLGGAAP